MFKNFLVQHLNVIVAVVIAVSINLAVLGDLTQIAEAGGSRR